MPERGMGPLRPPQQLKLLRIGSTPIFQANLHNGIFQRVMRVCSVYFAASLVSSTVRPLYSPHLGQARWGSFFSWQFGHSDSPLAVRKSWARRLAVRREEWRLFGFGMLQFLSCSRPHRIGTAFQQLKHLKINFLRTLSGCGALKAPPNEGHSGLPRRSIPGCCGSDHSVGKVLCSQACTAS